MRRRESKLLDHLLVGKVMEMVMMVMRVNMVVIMLILMMMTMVLMIDDGEILAQ